MLQHLLWDFKIIMTFSSLDPRWQTHGSNFSLTGLMLLLLCDFARQSITLLPFDRRILYYTLRKTTSPFLKVASANPHLSWTKAFFKGDHTKVKPFLYHSLDADGRHLRPKHNAKFLVWNQKFTAFLNCETTLRIAFSQLIGARLFSSYLALAWAILRNQLKCIHIPSNSAVKEKLEVWIMTPGEAQNVFLSTAKEVHTFFPRRMGAICTL